MSGRLRNLLQQAQTLVTDLRALPLDAATTQASYPRVFELVRLINRFQQVAAELPKNDANEEATRASWMQRAAWLLEDAASLAQERVFSTDSKQLCSNLIQLLCTAATACDHVLREKAGLELQLQEMHKRLAEMQGQAAALATLQAQCQAMASELLEARSQVTVLKQQLTAQVTHTQDTSKHTQMMEAEAAQLREQLSETRAQLSEAQELADSRVQVIQMLMEKAESGAQDKQEAANLKAHCQSLSEGLEANARVVEKLIELNTELMEVHNAVSVSAARQQTPPNTEAGAHQNGSQVALDMNGYTHHQQGPGSAVGHPPTGHQPAWQQQQQAGAPVGPSPAAAPPAPSFADAFTMFMSAPSDPEPATAKSLAMPPAR